MISSTTMHSQTLRYYSLFLLFYSSSSSNNRALILVRSIDDYLCQNYVFTCFFRQRYHSSSEKHQADPCRSLLILRSCLHHDIDTIRMCHSSALTQAKNDLRSEASTSCLTSSSMGKALAIQHLHSLAPARPTIYGCWIFVMAGSVIVHLLTR